MPNLDPKSVTSATIFIVRVVAKSGYRHRVEEHDGELKVTNTYFTMTWATKYGEIHTMAFKEAAYAMIHQFQEGQLYEVSKVKTTRVKKFYWHPKVPFHVILTQFTKVRELNDNPCINPMPCYNFTRIQDLPDLDEGEIVDILAVVLRTSKLRCLHTRTGGRLPMKQVVLLDQTGHCVHVTFWGMFAMKFFHTKDTVMMFKSCRVKTFNGGTCLTYVADCVLKFNPNIPKADMLRRWFQSHFSGKAFNISLGRYELK